MKFYTLIIFSLFCSSLLFSLGKPEISVNAGNKIVVALILDKPGIGDDSVNDSCYEGLQQAADEGLITLRVKTSEGEENTSELLNRFVKEKVDAVFLIGEINKELLVKSSSEFKETLFFGIDIIFKSTELKENLTGITFREQDGGYLAGIVAGNLTYRYMKYHSYMNDINRVGIILGKNIPEIKRYEVGFYAGVKEVNPSCDIISININSLTSPEKGENALRELKEKGVDIVFSVAGDSDEGVFKAAEDNDILVIGANKDLSSNSTNVLTSVVKKMSVSTYLMTKDYVLNGIEVGENRIYGLNEGAISLAPYYKFDKYVPKELRVIVNQMSIKLIKGSKSIPENIDEIIFDLEDIPEILE